MMSFELKLIIDQLKKNDAEFFKEQKITSVQHGSFRERTLVRALEQVAMETGVKLQKPLRIDARGEFNLVVDGPSKPPIGTILFGAKFAELLTAHNPRCGVSAGATISPTDGWCMLNHFDAERLVYDYADQQANAEITKEQFLALQAEAEQIELAIAQGHDTPETDQRLAEIDRLMNESKWVLIPDEGCVEKASIDYWPEPPPAPAA